MSKIKEWKNSELQKAYDEMKIKLDRLKELEDAALKLAASNYHDSHEPESEIVTWVKEQLHFFTHIEGEIEKISRYNSNSIAIKFKAGNIYTLKIEKQCQVVLDKNQI